MVVSNVTCIAFVDKKNDIVDRADILPAEKNEKNVQTRFTLVGVIEAHNPKKSTVVIFYDSNRSHLLVKRKFENRKYLRLW